RGSVSCSDSPLPVSSRVCFVKFHDPDSAVVAQHLTNTVFVDRALIVVPYAEGCYSNLKGNEQGFWNLP
uniref:RRM domain-containing protein n=1 Tax=Zonotrichia albicollis TaxID=44394 RepID=A0A8D2MRI5_ZONAL